ncbi:hypothetical protein TELCIR_10833 [Teladorsagia circumcincta]|uniref:RRM domain-containing protein n=1 Tax=Teladorsagia circumcincta TaxID=45464 RepID=A0A2G9UB19_TELCI|nr:hypothetical protein TELCIR_10833 [Teladorsagia circumcincta]
MFSGGMRMSGVDSRTSYAAPPRDDTPLQDGTPLSSTNLYIRGLSPSTTDEDLRKMCAQYGTITSTKEKCEEIIAALNGKLIEGMDPNATPLLVKQADTGRKNTRKRSDMGFELGIYPSQPFTMTAPHDYMRNMGGMPQMYPTPYVNYSMGYPQQVTGYTPYDVNAMTSQMGGMQIGGGAPPSAQDNGGLYMLPQQGYYVNRKQYNGAGQYDVMQGPSGNGNGQMTAMGHVGQYAQPCDEDPYRKMNGGQQKKFRLHNVE